MLILSIAQKKGGGKESYPQAIFSLEILLYNL